MFENKTKNWYGSYSRVGKISAENFYSIVHKDAILNRENKRINNFYGNKINNLNYLDCKINLNKIINTKYTIINNSVNKKKRKFNNYKKKDSFKYKYHHLHNENLKFKNEIYTEPTCTKYNPNYEYVHKKLITGPKWDDLLGRNIPIQNMENTTFYLIKSNGKEKEINKDKDKDNNIKSNNIKINDKNKKLNIFFKNKTIENNKINSKNTGESKGLHNITKTEGKNNLKKTKNKKLKINRAFKSEEKKDIALKNKDQSKINNSNNSFRNIKRNLKLSLKDNYFLKMKNLQYSYLDSPLLRRLSAITPEIYEIPEISKTMTHQEKEDIKQFKKRLMPKTALNYSLIIERPLSLVIYKKNKNMNKERKKFIGIEPSLNFDIDKIINKYNNHVFHNAPSFDNMTSRPYNKTNPLPNFMQRRNDRMSVNNYNDKTLKLNGYSDGKFLSSYNSFFPKQSFNTFVNLSLLRGSNIIKNMDEYNEKQIEKLINRINLKNKNYKQLILDGSLNKFDKITFKTDNKKAKFNKPLLRKILLNENINT